MSPRNRSYLVLTLLAAAWLIFLICAFGLELLEQVTAFSVAIPAGFVFLAAHIWFTLSGIRRYTGSDKGVFARKFGLELALLVLSLLSAGVPALFVATLGMLAAVIVAGRVGGSRSWHVVWHHMEEHPARLVVASFAAVVLVGSAFLSLPSATTDHKGAGFVDALFTATSATCVTGLTVVNTASDAAANPALQTFSLFGQIVILLLIQVGALGIMTLSSSLLLMVGRQLALRSRQALGELLEESRGTSPEAAVAFILRMTVVAEVLGAVVLYWRFRPFSPDEGTAAWQAVFHSISAFCNAGFSLFGDSMVRFRSDPIVLGTLGILIFVGGLGYPVVALLFSALWFSRARSPKTWGIHARMVLVVSGILLLAGALVTWQLEYDRSMAGLSEGEKLLSAMFQSVTARTAGFNTLDVGSFHPATLFVFTLLMFIGASPGGTGGGVKTTTVGVLLLSVRSFLYRRKDVEVWGRRIETEVVVKSISIIAVSTAVIAFSFCLLLLLEPGESFEGLLFETVSAFGTVGLSTGVTSRLSLGGKLVVTMLMFVGRLGPLTMALAFKVREKPVAVKYAAGRIAVG